MEISVKDLYAVADAAKAMAEKMRESADSAAEMAKAVQTIVDDCAAQMKAKKGASAAVKSAEKSEAPAATNTPVQNEPVKKKITLVELRAYVAERSSPQTRPKIKEILTRFGAAKLTELAEEQYAPVMDEVAKL